MDSKKVICVVSGLLLIVLAVVIFMMGMSSGDIRLKIAGGAFVVAGLAFFAESMKKNNSK